MSTRRGFFGRVVGLLAAGAGTASASATPARGVSAMLAEARGYSQAVLAAGERAIAEKIAGVNAQIHGEMASAALSDRNKAERFAAVVDQYKAAVGERSRWHYVGTVSAEPQWFKLMASESATGLTFPEPPRLSE